MKHVQPADWGCRGVAENALRHELVSSQSVTGKQILLNLIIVCYEQGRILCDASVPVGVYCFLRLALLRRFHPTAERLPNGPGLVV